MKRKEFRALSTPDLQQKKTELQKELLKHYAHVATGTTPKSPGQIRSARRTVARINTVLNERRNKKPA